uniref:Acyl-ACP thioesterase-like C-terminal domain-containing protein n=1 Tax=Aplanochytrium stocchinoi TaxID=215587 RepID=A0A7S3V2M9_9STRA|mmetsp:Transcript_13853/g.17977  ORF Transcript_13853/g.17977 Transcript_13853/m.17977 type:complete len:294 (+) Transcript_13853:156-1037(+)
MQDNGFLMATDNHGFEFVAPWDISLFTTINFHDFNFEGYLLPSRLVSYSQEFSLCPGNMVVKMAQEGNLPIVRSMTFQWVTKDGPVGYGARIRIKIRERFGRVLGESTFSKHNTYYMFSEGQWVEIARHTLVLINTWNGRKKKLPDWFKEVPEDSSTFENGQHIQLIPKPSQVFSNPDRNWHPEHFSSDVMARPSDCDMNKHVNFANYVSMYENDRHYNGHGAHTCRCLYIEYMRETRIESLDSINLRIHAEKSEIVAGQLRTKLYLVKDAETTITRCLWIEDSDAAPKASSL